MLTTNHPKPAGRFGLFTWAAALALAALTGCGRGDEKAESPQPVPSAPPTATAAPAPAAPPLGDADLLTGVPVGAAVTNKALAAADQAWMDLLTAMRPPRPPAAWETNQPSEKEVQDFRKSIAGIAVKTSEQAQEFYTKYPDHDKASEARDREQALLNFAAESGETNALARLERLQEARLKDPNLPEDERLQLRVHQVQRSASRRSETDKKAALTELEKDVRGLLKEFPKTPELAGMLIDVGDHWINENNPVKARALATEVSTNTMDVDLKAAAEALIQRVDRLGKPLDIKFTAIDGRAVDLSTMKGKVVLVDFWATWCVTCVEELPKLKSTFEKLHAKGFEIVGISVDTDKELLQEFLDKSKVPWPISFDGDNKVNGFGQKFQIGLLPTMWLVDKQGNLRDLNARLDLETKVEKLLAEK